MFGAGLAFAQSSGNVQRESEVEEEVESGREVERTAEEALDLEAFGAGPPVSYADVLADPDNIDLNFRYALTQIRQGNVRGAGATLERILLIRPDLAVVRVLFAVVMFRLDNLDEAERELLTVREFDLEPALRREIDRYLDQIALRRKRTVFTLSTNLSVQFDWNRNASPKSEIRLAIDLPTRAVGPNARQDDLSLNGLAQLSFEHDLGLQKRHMMIGGFVFYQGEQIQQDDLDLRAVTGDFGFELDYAPDTFIPRLLYENIALSREKYVVARGAALDWTREFSNTWSVFANGTVKYQAYQNISTDATASQRTGTLYEAELGTTQVLSPRQRLRVSFGQARNVAARGYHSYDRHEASASHTYLFEEGDFLISSVTATYDRYDRNDPAISARNRHDKAGRIRLTYGAPWGTLFGDVPEFWRDFTLTVSGEAFRQVSSITNYTYNNYRFSVGINRRWTF